MTDSVLSYWGDYFHPDRNAPRADHSTGLIASHLHRLLSAMGPVEYFDNAERPNGLRAQLFVGHFWSFASMCRTNEFDKKVAVYVLSDPKVARALLIEAATHYGVPMPDWDLPPADFDHEATMELADLVLLCGNQYTLETFPRHWRPKVRLFNYALDERKWPPPSLTGRTPSDFVYVASHCGLRKGFVDVLNTWSTISPDTARLHVVGHLESPFDHLLAEVNTGSVVVHGWIDSSSKEYRELLSSCRFAYVPTWVEGQMGTMLEAIFAGCVPITTLACGVDDSVLAHCLLVDPLQTDVHRSLILDVVGWSFEKWRARSEALQREARLRHNWTRFDHDVTTALTQLLDVDEKGARQSHATY